MEKLLQRWFRRTHSFQTSLRRWEKTRQDLAILEVTFLEGLKSLRKKPARGNKTIPQRLKPNSDWGIHGAS
jgi:hypothetical protein